MVIWVIKSFSYSSFVYFSHLFSISSGSVSSVPYLSFIVPIFACNIPLLSLIFLKRSQSFPFYYFPLFLFIDPLGRLSLLPLLFFGTLHSGEYIFPFILCLLILFFPQLSARPHYTTFCLIAFLFNGDGFDQCLLYNVKETSLYSFSGTLSIRSNLLSLVTSTVQ